MDPLTHALSGMAGSYCLPSVTKRQSLYCIIAASLPDIDNFVFLFGEEAYLLHHRGFCHSFIGGIVLASLLVWIFRIFDKQIKWFKGFYIAFGLICLHLFLDVITSYGTQLFLPFSNLRCTIPCVFILDFLFTGILLIGVIWCFFHQKYRKTIATLCMGFIIIYPGFNKIIQLIKLERSKTALTQASISYHKITVLPALLAPFNWKIIVERESTYELYHLPLMANLNPNQAHIYEKADLNRIIDMAPNVRFIKTFDWFVDYPAAKYQKTNQNNCITFFDLKFITVIPWFKNLHNFEKMPFKLRIFLDDEHQYVSYSFF
ncbi:membrane protein containing DUF457, transmembrane [Candidatus Magnetomorum sp. HK-1]|nr:membrane protein containing DUF457, transmembrane [Candidatus Magnetomorum sp. HK-1]